MEFTEFFFENFFVRLFFGHEPNCFHSHFFLLVWYFEVTRYRHWLLNLIKIYEHREYEREGGGRE